MANQTERISMRGPLVVFLVLCLVGIGVAVDLTLIHVKVHTDPSYRSFCALSEEVNCDTVAESDYSVFLGVPNSVWGLLGYLVMTVLAGWGLHRRHAMSRAWPSGLLLLLAIFSLAVAVVLAAISKLIIHSMCLMCMASWLVAAGLFVAALIPARKVGILTSIREDVGALLARPALAGGLTLLAFAVVVGLVGFYPKYWTRKLPVGPGLLASGTEGPGLPWVGAKEPLLVIYEYSDYECPHCSREHSEVRANLRHFPEVRLVHRNFPLDHACNPIVKRPFHPNACQRALAAICAGKQGRFWEMNDRLFLGQRNKAIDVHVLAQQVGLSAERFSECLESPEAKQELTADMDAARARGVDGTPWFLVDAVGFAGKLDFHKLALAVCAQEQGKFAPVREQLFSRGDKDATAESLAKTFGLDLGRYQNCIDRHLAK